MDSSGRVVENRHLTLQVFTSTSTIAFEAFSCDEEAVAGESFLRADYRVSCNTTKHKWYMAYAGIMIVVSDSLAFW